MSTPLNKVPRSWAGSVAVTGADCSATMATRVVERTIPTVATTGTTEQTAIMPFAGTITAVRACFKDALTQHATNYLTFAIKNKGQAGAGTTDVLSTADANTTKTTTGTAIAAYTARGLTLNATAANLVVAAGDVLAFQCVSAATLANTLTEGGFEIEFTVTS